MKNVFTTILLVCFASITFAQTLAIVDHNSSSTEIVKAVEISPAKQARIAKRQNKSVANQLQSYMAEQMKYTEVMAENCMEGETVLQIEISNEGKIVNTKVVKSPNAAIEKAVMATMENLVGFDLKETTYYGHKKVRIPVQFSMK